MRSSQGLAAAIRKAGGRGPVLCLGVVAGTLVGGALVHAQGGGAAEIRACVVPVAGNPSAPNIRILGQGESCPGGTTPLNWNAQGPAGPPGRITPQQLSDALEAPAAASPNVPQKALAKIATGVKTAIKVKTETDNKYDKWIRLKCPSNFPLVVAGDFTVTGPGSYKVLRNHAIYWGSPDQWWVQVARDGPYVAGEPPLKQWTLKVRAKCAKKAGA